VPSAVLKVPHHGSRTSSTPALLDRVRPLVALTGAGRDNRYGFPHASVSARYAGADVPLYWTGRHGALRACTDGWSIHVEQAGEAMRWRPLRSWGVDEVAAWSAMSVEAPALEPVAPRCAVGERPRRKRSGKRKRAKRKRSRKEAPSTADPVPAKAEAAVEPPPASLAPDRAWERDRKRRGRLKAPWKR
jgi:hypothetical protein